MIEYFDEYVHTHPRRVCREKCLELGLTGEDLEKCIDDCVREIRTKDEDRSL